MSQKIYENHGKAALLYSNPTQLSGRYFFQKTDERNILVNIAAKLELVSTDKCLDIGCGVGNILIPMSFLVETITGIDHPNCLNFLKNRYDGENIKLIGADFISYKKPLGVFDKILIYSVLQAFPDMRGVTQLINKAVKYLGPGGKMLLGDIPNTSLKNRFLSTEAGKVFEKEWRQRKARSNNKEAKDSKVGKQLAVKGDSIVFDDENVLELVEQLRNQGLHAFILPQPKNLPFGNTREDILILKP